MQSTACVTALTKPEAAARLLELIQLRLVSEAIHVVAALRVADLLASGPMRAHTLAETLGTDASLRRVMRALARFEVFSQTSDDRFELGPAGEFLRRDVDGSLQSAALFFGGENGTNVVGFFMDSVRTGESGVQKLAGGKGIFGLLEGDRE
jgi:hypothetical protein